MNSTSKILLAFVSVTEKGMYYILINFVDAFPFYFFEYCEFIFAKMDFYTFVDIFEQQIPLFLGAEAWSNFRHLVTTGYHF